MTDDDLEARFDDLEARFDALNRARMHLQERVDEVEAENESLRERVADLEQVVDPDPGAVEYDELSRPRKVHRVRRRLVETAARTNGKAAMQYSDVMWLFDGHPSRGHCYDLMSLAGDLDGFRYDNTGDTQHRILANLDGVNDETLIHAANTARGGEGV
ncbi:MAG: hypothetical protein ABEH58_07060 [Haloplanus sp.]